jgi:hypothetical protein
MIYPKNEKKTSCSSTPELSAIGPNINMMKPTPADAEQWKDVPWKRKLPER